jgi:hypothetical protein
MCGSIKGHTEALVNLRMLSPDERIFVPISLAHEGSSL